MKFTTGVFTAAVGILGVAAHAGHDHDLILSGNVPDCAVNCINDSLTKYTDCKEQDAVCMCNNFQAGYWPAIGCVLDACGHTVAQDEAFPAVQKLCIKAMPDQAHDAIESVILEEIGIPAPTAASNSVLVLAPSTAAATLATSITGTAAVATQSASGAAEESAAASATAAVTTAANSAAGRVAVSLMGVAGLAVALL
ncbi:hypothetical protein QBC37DRAFT_377086 [Rhypophila decipiens]|uniref:CFEM domain-containing protein n=1 Tax=Rhypophila decipiens TaxID=261697 RepID=A0AAN6Y175_9PEZI|nr:hypothetical protein QBC37DRAFT_377086 [Rhypophila decipiens]